MIHDRAIVLALCTCWPAAGAAQQRAPSECVDTAKTQAAIAGCSSAGYKAVDRRLESLLREVRASVSAAERAQLDSAQRAWTVYAAVQCRLEAAPYAGGTIYATQVTSCQRVLAERRVAELAPLLCRQSGQPGQPCPAADRYRQPDRAASKRRR
jgi:uncharacterized protein YecT (DUF1311 family)